VAKTFQKAFSQTYTLKQGTKKSGEKGKQAVVTEMKQSHDRSCFKPVDANKLTDKHRRQTMNSLFFITEKKMVESKGVAVVDIPNAFVQTNNDKLKSHHRTDIVKVKGSLADMLVEIDSDTCGPHLIKEIGVS